MKKLIIIVVSLIFTLSACKLAPSNGLTLPDFNDGGAILLILNSNLRAATITPPDLEVFSYIITGTHENSVDTFSDLVNKPDTSLEIPGLLAGDWDVTVDGYDALDGGGIKIATATVLDIAVSDNNLTARDIEVLPLTGTGTTGSLAVDLSWSVDDVPDPLFTIASLANGGTSYDHLVSVTASVDSLSGTASFAGDFEAGYYILTLTLENDTGPVFSKTVRAVVRIVDGYSTAGSVDFDDPGGLSINITEDLKNPFGLIFTDNVTSLSLATSDAMIVTVAPDSGVGATYWWYLNGTDITVDETQDFIAIDSRDYPIIPGDYPVGFYNLTAIVTVLDGAMSSDTISFTVDP